MELKVETTLSAKPVLEPNDRTALTEDQQRTLDEYKVIMAVILRHYVTTSFFCMHTDKDKDRQRALSETAPRSVSNAVCLHKVPDRRGGGGTLAFIT